MKIAISKVEKEYEMGSAPIGYYIYDTVTYILTEEQLHEIYALAQKYTEENSNE